MSRSRSPDRRGDAETPRAGDGGGFRGRAPEGCKVYIANVSDNVHEGDLRDILSKYGQIEDISIAEDRESGRRKGFAFATMGNPQDAEDAVRGATGQVLDGREIRVEISTGNTRRERPRSNVCYDWQKDQCTRGDSCRFSHSENGDDRGGGYRGRDDRGRDDYRRDDYRRDGYRGSGGGGYRRDDRGGGYDRRDDYRRDDRRDGGGYRRDDRRDDYRGGGSGGGGYRERSRDRGRY